MKDEFIAKNGRRWGTKPPTTRGRQPIRNIIRRGSSGPTGTARLALTIVSIWELFVTDNMIHSIIRHTVEEANRRNDA